jgi:hypothetical protein
MGVILIWVRLRNYTGFFSLGSKCSSAKYCGHIYANVSAYLWYGTVVGTVLQTL